MSNNEQTPDFPRNLIFHFSKNFGKKSWPNLPSLIAFSPTHMRHSGKSRWLYLSNVSTTPHPVCCLHCGAGRRHPCLHWSPASSPVGLFLPFSLSSVFSAAARVMWLLKTPSWLPLSKQTVLSGALDNPRDPCFPPHPHRPPCNAAEYASRALRGGCHASCLSPLLENLVARARRGSPA